MIFVISSWLIIFLGICGIGILVINGLQTFSPTVDRQQCNLFHLFWIGFGATVALAQFWHLFLPLNGTSLALWLAAGVAGQPFLFHFLRDKALATDATCQASSRIRIYLFVFSCIMLLYLGASGVATTSWSGAYDTDLYHFNAVRWMNEYAAIRGLGNLHSRLAHTSGFLMLAAVIDNLWWDRSTAWLIYGLVVSVGCVQWVWTILWPAADTRKRVRLFCILTFPYMLRLQSTIHPTLYFDEIALIVQLVLFAELLRGVPGVLKPDDANAAGIASRNTVTWLLLILAVAALGFSIKPIAAISLLFVSACAATVLIRMIRRSCLPLNMVARSAIPLSAIPAFVLIGHVTRNAILAGWLLYPAPLGQLDVPWAMPREPVGTGGSQEMQSVSGQYKIIKAWARLPGTEYAKALSEGFSYWFPRWLRRSWYCIETVWLGAGAALITAHLCVMLLLRRKQKPGWYEVALIILVMTNLAFWFLTAPDLRFGRAFFWIFMAVPASMLLSKSIIKIKTAYIVAALLAAGSLFAMSVSLMPRQRPTLWLVGKAFSRPTETVVIDNGEVPPLIVHVPMFGDQCGDSPIPATPYPRDELRLLEPGSIKSGFMTCVR